MRLPFFGAKPLPDAGPLYAAVVAEARRPDWYRDAGVPDTMDGRFAVLTTLLALADIRLERGADEARALGPRLTEAFIADIDPQIRQAGFGDPSLGKQVRTMVGALAGRVEQWRRAVEAIEPWDKIAVASLYRGEPAAGEAGAGGIEATKEWWRRLQQAGDGDLRKGLVA